MILQPTYLENYGYGTKECFLENTVGMNCYNHENIRKDEYLQFWRNSVPLESWEGGQDCWGKCRELESCIMFNYDMAVDGAEYTRNCNMVMRCNRTEVEKLRPGKRCAELPEHWISYSKKNVTMVNGKAGSGKCARGNIAILRNTE